jgi:hypothetical protein
MLNKLTDSLIACESEEAFENWFSLHENPSDELVHILPEIEARYAAGSVRPEWVFAFGQFVLGKKQAPLGAVQALLVAAQSALRDLGIEQYSRLLVRVCGTLNGENPVQSEAFLDELLTALLKSFRSKEKLLPTDVARLSTVLKCSAPLREQIVRKESWQFCDILRASSYELVSQFYPRDVADSARSCGLHLHFVEAIVEIAYKSPNTQWLEHTFKIDSSSRAKVFDKLPEHFEAVAERVPEINRLQNPSILKSSQDYEQRLEHANLRKSEMRLVAKRLRSQVKELKSQLADRVSQGLSESDRVMLAVNSKDREWREKVRDFVKYTHVLHDRTAQALGYQHLRTVYHQCAEAYLNLGIEVRSDQPARIYWLDESPGISVSHSQLMPRENQGE